MDLSHLIVHISCLLVGALFCSAQDACTTRLNRCAEIIDDHMARLYRVNDQPTFKWVSSIVLLDPTEANGVCRTLEGHFGRMECFKRELSSHTCWSNTNYYRADRYFPENEELYTEMKIFCQKRRQFITITNCMLMNVIEKRKKDRCIKEEEKKTLVKYGRGVNDQTMCSYFHGLINCYRLHFGAICRGMTADGLTMEAYFRSLRKLSRCNMIDGASTVTLGFTVMCISLLVHLFL